MYSSASLPRIVPWSSWQEWEDAYAWLYSPDPSLRALGVKRVAAWKSRCKVPLSIESTATFVEIQQNDNFNRSENEKRMMYSMALNRMINGLVSPFQKSMYAVPIGQIAAKIGLPPVLVDLRHQASHNQMPSLRELRHACALCLDWLDQNYWRKQNEYKENAQQTIFSLVDKFKDIQKQLTASMPAEPDEDSFTLDEQDDDINDEVIGQQQQQKNIAKQVVSRDKIKQQRKKVMNDIVAQMTPNQVTLTLVPLLVDGNYLVPKKKRKLRKYQTLPSRVKKMWTFFIKRIASQWAHFIPTLLGVIADRIFKIDETIISDHVRKYHRSILLCWFQHLLTRYYLKPQQPTATAASGDDDSIAAIVPLPAKMIITICIRHANRHALKIIRMLEPLVESLGDAKETKRVKTISMYLQRLVAVQKYDTETGSALQMEMLGFADPELTPLSADSLDSSAGTKFVPVRDVSPGIGLLANGTLPQLNAMPLALDDFQLATFLISPEDARKMPPLPAPTHMHPPAVAAAPDADAEEPVSKRPKFEPEPDQQHPPLRWTPVDVEDAPPTRAAAADAMAVDDTGEKNEPTTSTSEAIDLPLFISLSDFVQ